MKRSKQQSAKRRTTLTLPADSLREAGRIARVRNVSLSAVVSEAFSEGMRRHAAARRSEEVLSAYKKAFSGFTEQEMLLLDGIVLEPTARRGR